MMKKHRWYNKKIFCVPVWVIGFAVLISAAGYAQQQTLLLSTYYPAPYGEYTQMRVADKLEVFDKLEAKDVFKIDLKNKDSRDKNYKHSLFVSKLYDLSQYNTKLTKEENYYSLDPAGVNRFKGLTIGDPDSPDKLVVLNPPSLMDPRLFDGEIIFGNMRFASWPVLAKPNYSTKAINIPKDAVGYKDITPAIPNNNPSMKICYGTYKDIASAFVRVDVSAANFTSSNYFIMVSPWQLDSGGTLITLHKHEPFNYRSPMGYFSYYKWRIPTKAELEAAKIAEDPKTRGWFYLAFEGVVPSRFDWLTMGK